MSPLIKLQVVYVSLGEGGRERESLHVHVHNINIDSLLVLLTSWGFLFQFLGGIEETCGYHESPR